MGKIKWFEFSHNHQTGTVVNYWQTDYNSLPKFYWKCFDQSMTLQCFIVWMFQKSFIQQKKWARNTTRKFWTEIYNCRLEFLFYIILYINMKKQMVKINSDDVLVSFEWRHETRNCEFIFSFVCDLSSFALHSSFNWSLVNTTFLMSTGGKKVSVYCLKDVYF